MKKFKFTWGHGIVLLLLSFMVFITTLVISAGNMGTLITEDSYELGLTYQNEIDAQKNYNSIEKKPFIKNQANGILITFPKEIQPIEGKTILKSYANNTSDLMLQLNLNRNHTFLIPANQLKNGEYQFQLFWKENEKEFLYKNQSLKWTTP